MIELRSKYVPLRRRASRSALLGEPGRFAAAGLWALALAGTVVVLLVPLLFESGTVLVMGEALILALFALSLNLLVGTTGLMSFGHAAYYGVGAFTVALLVTKQGWPPLLAFVLAPLTGAAFAAVSGLVVLRGTKLFFGLLTLGVAQLYWAIAQGWVSFTGGQNGLPGLYVPLWLLDLRRLYWFTFACVAVCAIALFVITRSPFGGALRGIRENRRRAEFIGLPVKRYELTAFVIAGSFAGIAGGLATMFQNLASSDYMDWRSSAEPLIVSLIGGINHFLGPALGAIFFVFLEDAVVARTVLWDVALGVVVLAVALVFPTGLAGGLKRALESMQRALGSRMPETAAQVAREPEASKRARPRTAVNGSRATRTGQSVGTPAIAVDGISKQFGGLVALDDVSFSVAPGSIHAIIGPNGAGKTTLFNVMTGLLTPDHGTVRLRGQSVNGISPWRLTRRGVGRSFQQASLFWSFSTFENVLLARSAAERETRKPFGGNSAGLRSSVASLLRRADLVGIASASASALSHGDQRALELVIALAVEANVLLLDEPTAGLSPVETRDAVDLIRRLADEQDLTVVFIEHDMSVVFDVADQVTVLQLGKVLAGGTPSEIRQNQRVQEAYLGETSGS